MSVIKTVAFIATGDEITDGDIINTNGPAMAHSLVERGLTVKQHLMVPDNEQAICAAIRASLMHHDIIIITGGLGPTSDDITRFALAKAVDKELFFDAASWQHILDRFAHINTAVGEHNRQQAYFPISSKVLPNPHGTANGCYLQHDNKLIFMLPGPPHECLPMFREQVLPLLPENSLHKLHWLLMGAGEGDIASKLDVALKPLNCRTGYRAAYPYLEIKVWAKDAMQLATVEQLVLPIVENFLVSRKNIPASQSLREYLTQGKTSLKICDEVTGGVLESTLLTPQTRPFLQFVKQEQADVVLTGLNEYWQDQPAQGNSEIKLQWHNKVFTRPLFYRGKIVRQFVTEWVCWQISSELMV